LLCDMHQRCEEAEHFVHESHCPNGFGKGVDVVELLVEVLGQDLVNFFEKPVLPFGVASE